MGRKENTVTGSHTRELDGCGVGGRLDEFVGGVFFSFF